MVYINRGIDIIDQQCHRSMGVPLPPFIFKLSHDQGQEGCAQRVAALNVGNFKCASVQSGPPFAT